MPQDPYASIAKTSEDPYAAIAAAENPHVGVNHGDMTASPGYRFSTGFADNGEMRPSGGFIDRSTEYLGRNLRRAMSHPGDTLRDFARPLAVFDSTSSARGELPPDVAGPTIEHYKHDPIGEIAGDAETAALGSSLAGEPPGANLATLSRSERVPAGIARPLQGLKRAATSMPRPDLISIVRDPVGSAVRSLTAIPKALKAGLGDDIRIQPVARPAPAWQTGSQAGTLVDSVLADRPQAGNWGDRPPLAIKPHRNPPAWQNPNAADRFETGATEVPSILNRQPYAISKPRIARAEAATAPTPIESPEVTPTAARPSATTSSRLDELLNDAVGGRELEPNTPLRQQLSRIGKPATPAPKMRPISDLSQQIKDSAPASDAPKTAPLTNLSQQIKNSAVALPEGFTPVESEVLRGYKYNPEAREFEAVTNNGQHYVHSDVSPEEAAKFESSDSKGTAWNQLRKGPGVTLTKKGPVGQVSPVKPGTLKTSKGVIAKANAGMNPDADLTDALEQSLKQARGRKASRVASSK